MSELGGADPSPDAESLDAICPGPNPDDDASPDPERGDSALDPEGAPLPAPAGDPPDGPPKLDDDGGPDPDDEVGGAPPGGGGGGGGAVTVNVAVTYPTAPVWSVAAITITPGGVVDGIVSGTLNSVFGVLARTGPVVPMLMSTDPPGGGANPPPATRMVAPGGPAVGASEI